MAKLTGYMSIQVKTYGTGIPRIIYVGDWADEHKRTKHMGKPRKYNINVHLYNYKGEYIVYNVPLTHKCDKVGLKHIHNLITSMLDEYPEQDFDLVNSTINVSVNYE